MESDHTPSADLDLATRGIVFAAAGTAGQRCTSMCRIIGHQDIADELTDRISQVYRRLPIGHPFADATFVGPLFDGRSHADMTDALGHAVAQDGQVLVGRHRDSAATTRPAPRSAVHSAARSHRRRPRIRLRRVARLHAPRHEHRQLLLAASWSPEDGKATPESVVMGYAAAARRHGARIIRHCAVTDIESTGGTITAVVTEHGRIATRTVVCAAGAWSAEIGTMVGVDIPVVPVRRQIAFTEPLSELPEFSPSLTIDFPSNFYFHPEGKGLLLGWSDPDEPEGSNLRFELEDWLMGLGAIAENRVSAVLDYGISTGWAGLYEVTPDRNQIIDRSPEVEGLLLATGYSGHGFLMGPATGEIVRDLYDGAEPGYDISSFTLDRFARTGIGAGETNIV